MTDSAARGGWLGAAARQRVPRTPPRRGADVRPRRFGASDVRSPRPASTLNRGGCSPMPATRAEAPRPPRCRGVRSGPVSTTGGGVTLFGRATSGSGTRVRVAAASSGTGGVTSPSISVRSTRSSSAKPGEAQSSADRTRRSSLRAPVVLTFSCVVLPSNEGGETNVVFGQPGSPGRRRRC